MSSWYFFNPCSYSDFISQIRVLWATCMVDAWILKIAMLVGARTRSGFIALSIELCSAFLMQLIRYDFLFLAIPCMTMYKGCMEKLDVEWFVMIESAIC